MEKEKSRMMDFRTEVKVGKGAIKLLPSHRMLFVGSCFADNLGKRFVENRFRAVVNPYGVMYNPTSVFHSVERYLKGDAFTQGENLPKEKRRPDVAFFTLGTNHVYILKETGEVVDNCQKRPQRLFEEKELTVGECVVELSKAVWALVDVGIQRIIVTVSPIRYAKYGFHGSQLSKATLLLAADLLCQRFPELVSYFPAYEIVNDELRDYRFYKEDMLHPSDQAVEYIWQKFRGAYFDKTAEQFLAEWQPIKEALAHKPFHPDSEETKLFQAQTEERLKAFEEKYHLS